MPWLIKHTEVKSSVGAKAKHLFTLKDNGFNVPDFVVIPFGYFESSTDTKQLDLIDELKSHFGDSNDSIYAVRSSSTEEDSDTHSFAGQFYTFLNVTLADIPNYVERVFKQSCFKLIKNKLKVKCIRTKSRMGL